MSNGLCPVLSAKAAFLRAAIFSATEALSETENLPSAGALPLAVSFPPTESFSESDRLPPAVPLPASARFSFRSSHAAVGKGYTALVGVLKVMSNLRSFGKSVLRGISEVLRTNGRCALEAMRSARITILNRHFSHRLALIVYASETKAISSSTRFEAAFFIFSAVCWKASRISSILAIEKPSPAFI